MLGNRDQAVPAAVADVEADPRALAIDLGEGLAVFAVAEGERTAFAAQPLAETDTQRRAAESELPPGALRQEATPAYPLFIV